ncbi:hypothetical protein BJ912DRAFT_1051145 [Pholiota molesta]|nr:hypothetical protein BJ912DRAFT_1051145 [Pholiota molesta]
MPKVSKEPSMPMHQDEQELARMSGPSIRTGYHKLYCRHALYTDHRDDYHHLQTWSWDDGRPYHYLDSDGSVSFRMADRSKYYYNNVKQYSRYTLPNGRIIFNRNNPDVQAERAKYCFACNYLDMPVSQPRRNTVKKELPSK